MMLHAIRNIYTHTQCVCTANKVSIVSICRFLILPPCFSFALKNYNSFAADPFFHFVFVSVFFLLLCECVCVCCFVIKKPYANESTERFSPSTVPTKKYCYTNAHSKEKANEEDEKRKNNSPLKQ